MDIDDENPSPNSAGWLVAESKIIYSNNPSDDRITDFKIGTGGMEYWLNTYMSKVSDTNNSVLFSHVAVRE